MSFSSSTLSCLLLLPCSGHIMKSCRFNDISKRHTITAKFQFWLLPSFCPFFCNNPCLSLKCGTCVVSVSIGIGSTPLFIDQLWFSVIASICCKQKIPLVRRKLHFLVYTRIDSKECRYELGLFNKLVVVNSPSKINSFSIAEYFTRFSIPGMIFLLLSGLEAPPESDDFHDGMHPTIFFLGLLWYTGHCCGSLIS